VSFAQVVVFAVAVCTARVRFRVCRCCMHCPRKFSCLQVLYALPSIFVFASAVCTALKCSCLQVLYALPAQMSVFAGAVCTARSSFRVCKCCMHCSLKCPCLQVLYALLAQVFVFAGAACAAFVGLSWLQVLYTLPAHVFVVVSDVYTSRSIYRGRKCCIHFPIVFSCSQALS